jgi:phage-related protein
MKVGYYPGWNNGLVQGYLTQLREDGQRKKAEAKLRIDLFTLEYHWPKTLNVSVRMMKGHEPLWELVREYQNIAYRIFFCVKGDEMWLLHAIEKKSPKTPVGELDLADRRMKDVLAGRVRR